MANSVEFNTTFLGNSGSFNGLEVSTSSIGGTFLFTKKVVIGSLIGKEWKRQGVEPIFPYGNVTTKTFEGQSFPATWNKGAKQLTLQLTTNNYWQLVSSLNDNHEVEHFYLAFLPKEKISINKLPGIKQKLEKPLQTAIKIYFATQDISLNDLTITKGISFKAALELGVKKYNFPTKEKETINCNQAIPPLVVQQSIGTLVTIEKIGFEYRTAEKNSITRLPNPNQLLLNFEMTATALTILKGNLKNIRIGLILDKLPQMQRFDRESNLALEVDFDLPITDKKTGKKRLIALRPMQWLRKIGFPPPWLPNLFKKGTPQPPETKGITITKDDLTDIQLLKNNYAAQKYIPNETILQRVVYDWKTEGIEMAVKVNFQAPLTQAELAALETKFPANAQLLAALQGEATKRAISIQDKNTTQLKKELSQYTGGFPLNKYPEIFKVNDLAIYIKKD